MAVFKEIWQSSKGPYQGSPFLREGGREGGTRVSEGGREGGR